MSARSTIYLLGDAILDNFGWLADKERDLNKELSDLGFIVNNCAVDEAQVSDLINGISPLEKCRKTRSYPYLVEEDGKMYPLRLIAKGIGINRSFANIYGGVNINPIGSSPEVNNMVVISMGGNNIQAKIMSILLGPEYFINAVITNDFIADYEKVIETVRTSCEKIVLVSIYLPYLGNGSSYGIYSPLAKPVINKWNNFINRIAHKYNIPVLDLSRSLDIGNRSHYGSIDTRPSNISNKCMAECIAYIHSHYDGYHVYYAPNLDYSNILIE